MFIYYEIYLLSICSNYDFYITLSFVFWDRQYIRIHQQCIRFWLFKSFFLNAEGLQKVEMKLPNSKSPSYLSGKNE